MLNLLEKYDKSGHRKLENYPLNGDTVIPFLSQLFGFES